MAKWLFQFNDPEVAQEMGATTALAIVEETHFRNTGALKSEHILAEMVLDTGFQALPEFLEEICESMFISEAEEADLRNILIGSGHFTEEKMF